MLYNFSNQKRIVIKLGSSLIVSNGLVRTKWLEKLAQDIYSLINSGHEVVIVSSGAIALGIKEFFNNYFEISNRSLDLKQKQAMAAIGQISLMKNYYDIFHKNSLTVAQILLTASDCDSLNRRSNFRNTIESLIEHKIIPIINENDSVAIDEIKIGDNDNLAAHVAKIIDANLMILFSDIDGLYDSNPKINKNAKFIEKVNEINEDIINMASDSLSKIGTGGMVTKIKAAQILQDSDCHVVISCGLEQGCLNKLINNKQKFTLFANK